MSSDFIPSSNKAEFLRSDAFWDRVNGELELFVKAAGDFAGRKGHQHLPTAKFLAFPNFGGESRSRPHTVSFGRDDNHGVVQLLDSSSSIRPVLL